MVFDWIIQTALWTALPVAALVWWHRKRPLPPPLAHALWLIVLIKFVFPPISTWSLPAVNESVAGLQSLLSDPSAQLREEESVVACDVVGSSSRQIARTQSTNAPTGGASERSGGTSPMFRVSGPPSVRQATSSLSASTLGILTVLWLLGAVVYLSIQGWRLWQLKCLAQKGHAAPLGLSSQVKDLATRLGAPYPTIRVVPGLGSPLVFGLLRPQLLWPQHLLDRKFDDGLRGVMVHELAHLARRDHWTGWIELLATSIWWWNPVLWYVRRQLSTSAELACDAWAVQTFPEAQRAYGDALIDAREYMFAHPMVCARAIVSGPRSFFERRLRMLMSMNVSSRMSRFSSVIVVALAVVMLSLWSATTTAAKPSKRHTKQAVRTTQDNDAWEVEVSETMDLSRRTKSIELHTNTGSITLIPSDDGDLSVDAIVRARKDRVDEDEVTSDFDDHVSVSAKDGVLTIKSAHEPDDEGRNPWSVSLTVMVPRDLSVIASSGAGDIRVSRASGSVNLQSGAGDVLLDVPESELTAITAHSGAGDVTIVAAGVDGEISVGSGAGAVVCRLTEEGASGAVEITTGAGDIALEVPDGTNGQFALNTPVGSIDVDSALDIERTRRSIVGERVTASLGEGGPTYKLQTGVGSIKVNVR